MAHHAKISHIWSKSRKMKLPVFIFQLSRFYIKQKWVSFGNVDLIIYILMAQDRSFVSYWNLVITRADLMKIKRWWTSRAGRLKEAAFIVQLSAFGTGQNWASVFYRIVNEFGKCEITTKLCMVPAAFLELLNKSCYH